MPRLKILVVDDEALVRGVVAECLEALDYTALQADSGASALTLLRECDDIQLLLSDIRMPEMSGIELAQIVGQWYPNLKIVLMTGYFLPAQQVNHRLLQKPFRIKELRSAISAELR